MKWCWEKILPGSCLALSVAMFTPFFGVETSRHAALAIHVFCFLGLGLLFELPELSLNLWCFWLGRTETSLIKNESLLKILIPVRYLLTHFAGPCFGIGVIASGLYLVHVGGYSLQDAWIFWIVVVSTVGLYKGIVQHNFYVKYLLQSISPVAGEQLFPQQVRRIRRIIFSPFDHGLIFLEFPTYVFIYMAAYFKPGWVNPFQSWVGGMEKILGVPALVGVFIVGAGGLFVFPLRRAMRKFSTIFA